MQVSIAPYDVRQGNFVGAGVNTVTRSGTNQLRGSVYYRFRNEDFVGTEAAASSFNPGTFDTKQHRRAGPAGRSSRTSCSSSATSRTRRTRGRCTTFRANNGGEPVGGNVTRVLASDLTSLSAFLKSSFNYDTGSFDPATDNTPQKRGILRSRLQPEHQQQDQLQLHPARLELRQHAVELDVGRHRPPHGRDRRA